MLVNYRKDYEKVTMGLMSFIPDFKNFEHLKTELAWYQAADNHGLFLWRPENGDFAGVIGVETEPDYVLVRMISLSPEDRTDQARNQLLTELAAQFPNQRVMGTLALAPVIKKWEQQHAR